MYLDKSYKYFERLYSDKPDFQRGLGARYYVVIVFFLLAGLFILPGILMSYLFGWRWLYGSRVSNGKLVEFVFGNNHQTISKEIALKNCTRFCFNVKSPGLGYRAFSDKRLMLIAIIHSWQEAALLLKIRKKSLYRANSVRIIKQLALSKFLRWHLKNVKVLVHYNDHTPYNVMATLIAQELGVKTVYIQHAPVSYRFPPLFNDLNVLFSPDSLKKYQAIMGDSFKKEKVFTFCDVRFPSLESLPEGSKDEVLVCFNKLDNLQEVQKCVKALLARENKVAVRPHPEDFRFFEFGANVRLSRGNTIWFDLSNAKAVIVNESAVPLEALYAKVAVYKLCTFSKVLDNYGFSAKKLITKEYCSLGDLLVALSNNEKAWDLQKLPYFIGPYKERKSLINSLHERIHSLVE